MLSSARRRKTAPSTVSQAFAELERSMLNIARGEDQDPTTQLSLRREKIKHEVWKLERQHQMEQERREKELER